ncbi:hypothetical protein GCM10007276_33490 [Agaricicola taiwanensis]|uniref:histidine kinase n=1 Tax=Agaricicola taiwanensis TaxID=591372 RepID=A0A8J3E093_9RHOB|nr:PAS domain S-box protein [Agaricicola taiwanensis]GGE53738.1 hypothetical protein GCM10007276_33490 [Agaricicola taiwanensis]
MNLLQQNVWPSGGGEMGALTRARDWSATKLGPSENWPSHLKSTLDGMLATALPCTLLWGRDAIVFYNDAARELMGDRHPKAFGQPIAGMRIDLRADWASVVERVWRGETVMIEDQPYRLGKGDNERHSWFTHYVSPLRDGKGEIIAMWAISVDTTARVDAERQRNSIEMALRDSEERHAFLLKLSDALRPLNSSAAVQETATRILGEHLGASRACYAEMLPGDSDFIVERDYHIPQVPSIAGRHGLSDFGQQLLVRFRAGETVVVDDIRVEPMFNDVERTAYEYLLIRAFVLVPLVKEGQLVAMLSVHGSGPRHWTAAEIALVEDTAERTWAALEVARAEAALRNSEERFRLMADAVPQIVWVTDFQGKVQFFNQQWFDYTGSSPDQTATPEVFSSYIHPDDIEATRSAFDVARWTGGIYRTEHRLRGADGTYRWFLVRAQPYRDPVTGVISQWFGASVDIHEHRAAEARLRKSEERFQQFGNASSNVLWIRDAKSLQWIYLTPAFETIYGLTREEALKGDNFQLWQDLILPEDRDRAISNVRRVVAGESVTFEYRIRRPSNGEIRWLRDTDFPLLDDEGRLQSVGGIGHDITDTHETNDRLQALVMELQHRTRNLMGLVGSLSDKTLENVSSLEEFGQRFRDRLGVLSRANNLLAHVDRGGDVTFDQVLDGELEAVGALDEPLGQRVRREGPPGVVLPATGVQALALALNELASNALRHGALAHESGGVDIRWRVEQDGNGARLILVWKETGVAIPQEKREGYGHEIIGKALPYQLRAETRLRFDEDGIFCSIVLPLNPRIARHDA